MRTRGRGAILGKAGGLRRSLGVGEWGVPFSGQGGGVQSWGCRFLRGSWVWRPGRCWQRRVAFLSQSHYF